MDAFMHEQAVNLRVKGLCHFRHFIFQNRGKSFCRKISK